jgi:hypothetical protein
MAILGKTTDTECYYLQICIGDRVRVKSLEEIRKITDQFYGCVYEWNGEKYRLTFMKEMERFCGKEFTVKHVSEEDGSFTLCGAETCKSDSVSWSFCMDMVEII